MNKNQKQGSTLILTVLLLASITILVGLGRLAMFRNQVQMRLDREREIQQEFATRSAMRWLEQQDHLPKFNETNRFIFPTIRGDIGIALCPALPIFPKIGSDDFDIATGGKESLSLAYVHITDDDPDKMTTAPKLEKGNDKYAEIALGDWDSKVGRTSSAWIDLNDEEFRTLWSNSDFGFRYLAYISGFCNSDSNWPSDVFRFSLTPFGKDFSHELGGFSIWIEQSSKADNSHPTLSLHVRDAEGRTKRVGKEHIVRDNLSKGFQISGTTASLLQQHTETTAEINNLRATQTLEVCDIDSLMGIGFMEDFRKACKDAGGCRLTMELDITRPRPENEMTGYKTAVTRIAVMPAYEYYTDLDWPDRSGGIAREVSTVIRVDPEIRDVEEITANHAITYDTHGTYMSRKYQSRGGEP